jgi:hypothetical protein
MPLNLQVDEALKPDTDHQPVQDENGNLSALLVASNHAGVFGVPDDQHAHFQIGLGGDATNGQASAKLSFAGFGIEHAGFVWIPDGQLSNGKLHLTFGGRSDPTPRSRQPARVTFQANGNVGIGTMTPTKTLEVNGDILATGDVSLGGADCAEDFDVRDRALLEAGMVMVIGGEERLEQCCHPYDRRVAGVLSGAAGCRPGIILGKQRQRQDRLPLALSGKVFCLVDAGYSAVDTGDLLTTSPTPGHAMRASEPDRAFGAVLGKALRPLPNGRGLLPILVCLH